MAQLVGTFMHSHGGTTSMPGELWRGRRLARPIREDVPIEDDETNVKKAARTHEGFRVLREKIAELRVEVLVIFSDDQLECFDFNNYPAFAIYVGEGFRKRPVSPCARRGRPADGPARRAGLHVQGASGAGGRPSHGGHEARLRPGFLHGYAQAGQGLAGGVIRAAEELTDWTLPMVPVMMNLYFAPQPTAMRCYQFGKAVREVIDEFPSDLRVGIVGSGGLWHTPGREGAWLNVDFDLKTLEYLRVGDARGNGGAFRRLRDTGGRYKPAHGRAGPQHHGNAVAGRSGAGYAGDVRVDCGGGGD